MARHQLLDPAVVEVCRRGAAVLDEDLGEVAAGTEGSGEGSFEDGGIDHRLARVGEWLCVPVSPPPRP
jgi:hypothetical protein